MKKYFFTFFLICLIFPMSVSADIIADVYTTIGSDYINQTEKKNILFKGIKALSETDNLVRFKKTNDKLFFYYNKKMLQSYVLPQEADTVNTWADFTKQIIEKAISVSPKVEIIDFEMPDRFAQSVFKGLDGYSHYYSAFSDEADKPHIIKRNYASRIVDNDILLIKILTFKKDVHKQVLSNVEECSKCKALILDLRGNHGGLLDEAIKITDLFLDEGIVTYTLSKDGLSPKFYTAKSGDVFANKPIVILIDGYSASASEVLAGAMSEQNRATLMGTKSYGKGTVQEVAKNNTGSSMALTTSFFYTPGGNIIDKKGLTPAICTGELKSGFVITDGSCNKEDRFTNEADVEFAVKFINGKL